MEKPMQPIFGTPEKELQNLAQLPAAIVPKTYPPLSRDLQEIVHYFERSGVALSFSIFSYASPQPIEDVFATTIQPIRVVFYEGKEIGFVPVPTTIDAVAALLRGHGCLVPS